MLVVNKEAGRRTGKDSSPAHSVQQGTIAKQAMAVKGRDKRRYASPLTAAACFAFE